jgi:hypothetical protein
VRFLSPARLLIATAVVVVLGAAAITAWLRKDVDIPLIRLEERLQGCTLLYVASGVGVELAPPIEAGWPGVVKAAGTVDGRETRPEVPRGGIFLQTWDHVGSDAEHRSACSRAARPAGEARRVRRRGAGRLTLSPAAPAAR